MGTSVDAFVGRFVEAFVGVLEGLKRKSTLVGRVVGAFVGDLVGALVGPLVGQGSLSPALCEAQIENIQSRRAILNIFKIWALWVGSELEVRRC